MRKIFGGLLIAAGVALVALAVMQVLQNQEDETFAQVASQQVVVELEAVVLPEPTESVEAAPAVPTIPDYQYVPDMDMPEVEINGGAYIGILEIPELDLSLPIISTTTMEYLRIAPCRYEGSAYLDNLILGAHNYDAHFGRLKTLSYGSEVRFTDVDGNVFAYTVADIEILQPDQVDALRDGNWPLTLYTCTIGGQTRVVVRCE